MIKIFRDLGIKADHAYTASLVTMGLTYVSYFASRSKSGDSKAQADRWGIFFSTWAPTLMIIGVALRTEELADKK